MGTGILSSLGRLSSFGGSCFRACAASYRIWVCASVTNLTYHGAFVRPENAVTYSAGNKDQNSFGDLPETTAFTNCAAKHERKIQ